MTTIKVGDRNRSKLARYKYKLQVKTYDQVLDRMFKIIEKFKLFEEMKVE